MSAAACWLLPPASPPRGAAATEPLGSCRLVAAEAAVSRALWRVLGGRMAGGGGLAVGAEGVPLARGGFFAGGGGAFWGAV